MMIIRLPFENYIRVLIAGRKSVEVILEELRAMDFRVDTKTVQNMREQMYLEQPDYFDNYNEAVDIEWLEHHNIDKMFAHLYEKQIRRSIDGAEGALKIFEDAQIYRIVTSMAFAGFDETDIELIVQGKLDVAYTLEDFREFLNYFFNVASWNKKDKEMYLNMVKDTDLKRAYKEAIKGDKNKLLWKLKLSPSIEFDEMLRDISYDSYYKFKDLVNHDPDLALKFAGMVEKITARMEKMIDERKNDTATKEALSILFEEDSRDTIKDYSELKKEQGGD